MDDTACNYDDNATVDDGTCTYCPQEGTLYHTTCHPNYLFNGDATPVEIDCISRKYLWSYLSPDGGVIYLQYTSYSSLTPGNLSCQNMFANVTIFGSQAICVASAPDRFSVILGYGANLSLGENLQVIFPSPMPTYLEGMATRPEVVVSLDLPDTLGVCQASVLVSASASGGAGQSLRYRWSISGLSDTTVINWVGSITDPSFSLPVTSASFSTDILLNLTVSNWLDSSVLIQQTLKRASNNLPLLAASAPSFQFAPFQPIYVPVTYQRYNCTLNGSTVTQTPVNVDVSSIHATWYNSSNPSIYFFLNLQLPAFSFPPGDYVLWLNVTDPIVSTTSVSSVNINILKISPVVLINGGASYLTVSKLQASFLLVSNSYDPSLGYTSASSLTYSWSCPSCRGDIFNGTSTTAPQASVFYNSLNGSAVVVLQVTSSLTQLSSSSSVTLNASMDSNPPQIQIKLESGSSRCNFDQPLIITSSGTYNYSTANFSWSCSLGGNAVALPDSILSTSLKGNTLGILANSLIAQQTYIFQLQVTDGSRGKATASTSVTINGPPRNGICSISNKTGTTVTLFTITCEDWTDDASDFPISYQFIANSNGSLVTLSSFQASSVLVTRLPPGNPTWVWIYIQDQFGATTSVSFSVTVTLDAAFTSNSSSYISNYNNTYILPAIQLKAVDSFLSSVGTLVGSLNALASNNTNQRQGFRLSLLQQLSQFHSATSKTIASNLGYVQLLNSMTSNVAELSPVYIGLATSLLNNLTSDSINLITASNSNLAPFPRSSFLQSALNTLSLITASGTGGINQAIQGNQQSVDSNTSSDITQGPTLSSGVQQAIASFAKISLVNTLPGDAAATYSAVGMTLKVKRDYASSFDTSATRTDLSGKTPAYNDVQAMGITIPPSVYAAFKNNITATLDVFAYTTPNIYAYDDYQKMFSSQTYNTSRLVSITILNNNHEVNFSDSLPQQDWVQIKIPYAGTKPTANVEYHCRYWNTEIGDWAYPSCELGSVQSDGVVCKCRHLSTFAFQYTLVPSWFGTDLTYDNLYAYPIPALSMVVYLGSLILILLPVSYFMDYMKDQQKIKSQVLKNRDAPSFLKSFREHHLWLSIFIRDADSPFQSTDRTISLYAWIGGTLIVNAAFWALDPKISPDEAAIDSDWREWRLSIICALIVWVPALTVAWCFQLQFFAPDGRKSHESETNCIAGLMARFPGYLYGLAWISATIIVCLFLGLQFDRSYGDNPNDSAWRWLRTTAYSNVVDFVILRMLVVLSVYVFDTCGAPSMEKSTQQVLGDQEPEEPTEMGQTSSETKQLSSEVQPSDEPEEEAPEDKAGLEEEEDDDAGTLEQQLSSDKLTPQEEDEQGETEGGDIEAAPPPKKKGKKKKKGRKKKVEPVVEDRAMCSVPKIRNCFSVETPAKPGHSHSSSQGGGGGSEESNCAIQ